MNQTQKTEQGNAPVKAQNWTRFPHTSTQGPSHLFIDALGHHKKHDIENQRVVLLSKHSISGWVRRDDKANLWIAYTPTRGNTFIAKAHKTKRDALVWLGGFLGFQHHELYSLV